MENLVTEVTGSAERHPGGTLPLVADVRSTTTHQKNALFSQLIFGVVLQKGFVKAYTFNG